jgi:hypothetical protein
MTYSTGEPVALRERCKILYRQLGRDGMLRQNDPVDTIMIFVESETAQLRAIAQRVVDDTNRNLDTKDIPLKYTAPYGAIAELANYLNAAHLPVAAPSGEAVAQAYRAGFKAGKVWAEPAPSVEGREI